MINLFLSYGGRDRDIARTFESRINQEFKDRIKTRVIEDENDYSGISWKVKVLKDLNKTSIFVILLTSNSVNRPWPNQELGYASALKDQDLLDFIIPIVETTNKDEEKIKYIDLKGLVTEDMDKIPFDKDNLEIALSQLIQDLQSIDIQELEKKRNPLFADLNDPELKIIEYTFREILSKEDWLLHFEIKGLSDEIPLDEDGEFVRDTLNIFQDRGMVDIQNYYYYMITPYGFFNYAPYFTNINPQQDLDLSFQEIIKLSKEDGSIDGHTIATRTGIPPFRVSLAVEILENEGLVKTHKAGGRHPFRFFGMNLTPKARKIIRKSIE
jgi:TIR domain-containing protein